ncbi:hypothetical protein ACYOEI_09330 [Singulisphaera rosea]
MRAILGSSIPFALALVITTSAAGEDTPKYRSLDELPKEDREVFEKNLAKYEDAEARKDTEYRRIAAKMPLLDRAREQVAELKSLTELLGQPIGVKRSEYQMCGETALRDYSSWIAIHHAIARNRVGAALLADPGTRDYVNEPARSELNAVLSGTRPQPQDWDLTEGLLPKGVTELGADEAGRIYLDWYRRKAERIAPESEKLARAMGLSRDIEDAAVAYAEAGASEFYFSTYVQLHKPRELEKAEGDSIRADTELSKLWPGWAEVLRLGLYAPTAASSPRSWSRLPLLLGINTVVILAVLAGYRIHKRRTSGDSEPRAHAV